MSIITSKPQKRHIIVDPIFILFFSALVILTFFAVSTGNIHYLVENTVDSLQSASASVPVNSELSFAADQKYWDANCTRGWSADSLCETIASRTQACAISVESAYCSEYDTYLKTR